MKGDYSAMPNGREITLRWLLEEILRTKRSLAVAVCSGAALLVIHGFLQPVQYTSISTIAPDARGVPSGRLGGLAAQLGVSMPPGAGVLPPPLVANVARSRALARAVVAREFQSIAESTLVARRKPSWRERLGFVEPDSAQQVDFAAADLQKHIRAFADQETGAVEVGVSASSPDLAAEVNRAVLAVLDSIALRARQSQSELESRFFGDRLILARDSAASAARKVADFLAANRSVESSPLLAFQLEQLQRDAAGAQALVQMVQQGFEQARLDGARSVPSVLTIIAPQVPAVRDSRRTALRAIVGALLGGAIFVMYSVRKNVPGWE